MGGHVRRHAAVAAALGALVAGLVPAASSAAADRSPAARVPATPVTWKPCARPAAPRTQCATIRVPLDYGRPGGRTATLALSRVRHTATRYQGPLLVNPGGPGGSGLSLASFVASSLPAKVAAQYDVIGFDPRGVGASRPALDCRPGHFSPVRPDPVPRDRAEEREGVARARSFAKSCATKYGDLLRAIDTPDTARDMDAIRAALGARRISYFGYSYGTYLGAVYARLFPQRVRRLVLDSVVDPMGVWYDDNIGQDYAFEARHQAFLAWVAKHDATYHLGTDPARVERLWYAMRTRLRGHPAGGRVGPGELEDTFIPGGYYNGYWPRLADGFSAYVRRGDAKALVSLYDSLGATDDTNGYTIYTAVQCRDARWPRDWGTWDRDTRRVYAKARFMAWNNAWYNAPCAFWPVPSQRPLDVTNTALRSALLFQATDDAATPFEGGVRMHRLLRSSRLVVEKGGANHGVTLSGNACLDGYLSRYLATGALPPAGHGAADATCAALPDPTPSSAPHAGGGGDGAALHRLVGAPLYGSGGPRALSRPHPAGRSHPGRGRGRDSGCRVLFRCAAFSGRRRATTVVRSHRAGAGIDVRRGPYPLVGVPPSRRHRRTSCTRCSQATRAGSATTGCWDAWAPVAWAPSTSGVRPAAGRSRSRWSTAGSPVIRATARGSGARWRPPAR
jgi:pimeloyl-ACP methyl ester carboxylesterase